MQPSNLNLATVPLSNNTLTGTTIAGTPTGTTDTAVLAFSFGVAVGDAFASFATTAAGGTVCTITQAGLWEFTMSASLIGAAGARVINAGIGLNMAAAPIVANPVMNTDGVIATAQASTEATATATRIPITLTRTIYVRAATILAGQALGAAGATIRFLATDGAAGAPVGLVTTAGYFAAIQHARLPF